MCNFNCNGHGICVINCNGASPQDCQISGCPQGNKIDDCGGGFFACNGHCP